MHDHPRKPGSQPTGEMPSRPEPESLPSAEAVASAMARLLDATLPRPSRVRERPRAAGDRRRKP